MAGVERTLRERNGEREAKIGMEILDRFNDNYFSQI